VKLTALDNSLVDDSFKGIPGGTDPFPLCEMDRQGWNVLREDLPLPLAVLKESALTHNSGWMRGFLALSGAKLCPHGKTTMAPQLYARQLADGAWGITLANVSQVQVARRFGVSRILMANQLVGKRAVAYVVSELKRDASFEFLCLVDSERGVELLSAEARRQKLERPLEVLVEGGVPGLRCGCRDLDSALAVARRIKAAEPWLALRGVEGFEGVIKGATPEDDVARVREYVQFLIEIARRCDAAGLFAPGRLILSAGGSAYYDLVAAGFGSASIKREFDVIIRSGCYLTHDSAFLDKLHQLLIERNPAARELGPGLRPALEVWSYVQSRPEPTRAILTMGKRDCSFDVSLPIPSHWFRPGKHARPEPTPAGHTIASLNDQHALVDVPADSPLAVGDMVACGISHPCTTFDRWQLLALVDEEYNVIGGIRTFF
jgi:D-serine dehydratase